MIQLRFVFAWWVCVWGVACADASTRASALPNADDEAGRLFARAFLPREYQGAHAIHAIAQGSDGIVYLGCTGALAAFDGQSWTRHEVPGRVVSLAGGEDGELLVATESGFYLLRREALGRRRLERLPEPERGTQQIGEKPSQVFRYGDEYRVGWRGKLLAWSRGSWREWRLKEEAEVELYRVADGVIVRVPGLALYEWGRGEPRELPAHPDLLRSGGFHAVRDERGLLARVEDGRAFRLENGSWEESPEERLRFFEHEPFRRALRLSNGCDAYVMPGNGGVVVPLPSGQMWRIDHKRGMIDSNVECVFEDAAQQLWISSNYEAVRVDVTAPYSIFLRWDGMEGTRPVAFRRWGGDFVIAQQRGVYVLTRARPEEMALAQAELLPFPAETYPWGIETDGEWLYAAADNGLHALVRGGSAAETVLREPVKMVKARRAGGVVLAFTAEEIVTVRRAGGSWVTRRARHGLGFDFTAAAWDGDETLWLASETQGFVALRATEDGWPFCRVERTEAPQAGAPAVHLVVETETTPWFATTAGLFRHDEKTRRFVADTRGQRWALEGKVPRALAVQSDGKVWVQLHRAAQPGKSPLVLLDESGEAVRTVAPEPIHLIDYGGVWLLACERIEGREFLWAGGAGGLLRCDWTNYPPPRPTVAPVLSVDEESEPIALEADSPVFAVSRKPLRFRFAMPVSYTGAAWEFETRLAGFDDAWSEASARGEAVFTNVPGGRYTFEVRARSATGERSPAAGLSFRVRPPWHRSEAAQMSYALAGLAAVAGFLRWRLRAGERERARLEDLVARRTAELQVAKEQADGANRAKSIFLANMSHELRTPLNAIIGYAQMLQRNDALPVRERERLGIINSSGEHLLQLLNEVLDLVKIEAGRMELRLAEFDLPPLLENIAAAVRLRAAEKGLRFETMFARELPNRVVGDAAKLRQVLENLLGNAIKFTAEGSVMFSAWRASGEEGASEGEWVGFAVEDTGAGVSEADRQRIFEVFGQASEGRPAEPGTGLGLPLCQRLLGLMGSGVEFESAPGRGSRFHFRVKLQTVVAGGQRNAERRITGYVGSRRRVLVIDDVAVNRAVVRDLLVPLGFEVTEAGTASAGIERAVTAGPDVVFLDLRLPDGNGIEVARAVRARHRAGEARLIALSASALAGDRDAMLAAGCDAFLSKPFREAELLETLGRLLGIEWLREELAAEKAAGNKGPAVTTEEWLELAEFTRKGQVVPLRRRLAEIFERCGDPRIAEVQRCVNEYRIERARAVVEEAVALATRPGS